VDPQGTKVDFGGVGNGGYVNLFDEFLLIKREDGLD